MAAAISASRQLRILKNWSIISMHVAPTNSTYSAVQAQAPSLHSV